MLRKILIFAAFALLFTIFAHIGAAQNVSIQLTPQGIPIQIPAPGGSFSYVIAATNNGATPQQATVWCMIILPNGNPWGPALGPVTVTLGAGQTLDRTRTQIIPAYAPTGDYTFNAYIGIYPNTVWDSDAFLFEKTMAGSEVWVARYNGPGNFTDEAHSLAVDGAGNVYVTGESYGSGTYNDYATVKYDANGNQLWAARYNGPADSMDQAYSLAVDGAGNVCVTGSSYGSRTYNDYATIKYDASGNELWVARYNGTGNGGDNAYSLAVDGGGNVYVTGPSWDSGTYNDYATIKYDASGNQLWVARYNGTESAYDVASSLAVDGGGNVYVTGWSNGGMGAFSDYATIKYDSSGNQLWATPYNGPGNVTDAAYSLAVDSAGNVYVTGYSYGSGTYADYATIKYDSFGNELWVARYSNNGLANSTDEAKSIAVDGGGNVYVTGWSIGSGIYDDYATIKYDAFGNELWVARYNGPGNDGDGASSLALDGGGNVYVTGYSYGIGTSSDFATIKYDASGNQLWAARFNGAGNSADWANSLALDGSGNVYVTGGSCRIGTPWDYATIKYSGGNIANWMPVEAMVLGQPQPQECRLEQNFPNPFNATTAISYQLTANSHVSLRVYDTAGRLVETLVDGWRTAGEHKLTWDASNVAAGIYFARMKAGDYAGVMKMVLVK